MERSGSFTSRNSLGKDGGGGGGDGVEGMPGTSAVEAWRMDWEGWVVADAGGTALRSSSLWSLVIKVALLPFLQKVFGLQGEV